MVLLSLYWLLILVYGEHCRYETRHSTLLHRPVAAVVDREALVNVHYVTKNIDIGH